MRPSLLCCSRQKPSSLRNQQHARTAGSWRGGNDGERSDLGSSSGNPRVRLSRQHSWAAPAIPAKCGSICAACSWNPSAKELKTNQFYWPADARAISIHFWQHMPVHCSGSTGTHLPSPGCCSARWLPLLGNPLWAPTSSKAEEQWG